MKKFQLQKKCPNSLNILWTLSCDCNPGSLSTWNLPWSHRIKLWKLISSWRSFAPEDVVHCILLIKSSSLIPANVLSRQRCRNQTFNNYWMRLSVIARIIKAEVCVICRSRRLRRITQTEALIILAIMRKPNPIIVLLCIFLSKCSMCSLNKKYHPLFELLHKTAALAHLQVFLLFEVHLLSFLSNIEEKLSVYIFIIKKEGQVFCR